MYVIIAQRNHAGHLLARICRLTVRCRQTNEVGSIVMTSRHDDDRCCAAVFISCSSVGNWNESELGNALLVVTVHIVQLLNKQSEYRKQWKPSDNMTIASSDTVANLQQCHVIRSALFNWRERGGIYHLEQSRANSLTVPYRASERRTAVAAKVNYCHWLRTFTRFPVCLMQTSVQIGCKYSCPFTRPDSFTSGSSITTL